VAKQKQVSVFDEYDFKQVKSQLDVLLVLWRVIEESNSDPKALIKFAKRMRAKLNHFIRPAIFEAIITSADPVETVSRTIDDFLDRPVMPPVDLAYHGVVLYKDEWTYVTLGSDYTFQNALRNEVSVCEALALEMTQDAGEISAKISVILYHQHGFTGNEVEIEVGLFVDPAIPITGIHTLPKKPGRLPWPNANLYMTQPEEESDTPESEYHAIQAEYVIASGRGTGLLARLPADFRATLNLPVDHLDAFYSSPKDFYESDY